METKVGNARRKTSSLNATGVQGTAPRPEAPSPALLSRLRGGGAPTSTAFPDRKPQPPRVLTRASCSEAVTAAPSVRADILVLHICLQRREAQPRHV